MSFGKRAVTKEQLINTSTLFFVLCSLIFVSCPDVYGPIKHDKPKNLPPGMGYFSFSFKSDTIRTIVPEKPGIDAFNSFILEFCLSDSPTYTLEPILLHKEDFDDTGLKNPIYLWAGMYNLEISAYYDVISVINLVPPPDAIGKINNIDIKAGDGVKCDIPLSIRINKDIGDYEGIFRWNIPFNFSSMPNTAEMHIKLFKNGEESPKQILEDTVSNAWTGSCVLKAGYYEVVITLKRDSEKTIVFNEIVHIYRNLESVLDYLSFSDDDFLRNQFIVTFDYSWDDTPRINNQERTHGTLAMNIGHTIQREGFRPESDPFGTVIWYTDISRLQPYNFNYPVVDNITLYVKWIQEDKDFDEVDIFIYGTYTYTGEQIIPDFIVYYGSNRLDQNVHYYPPAFHNNENAGINTAILEITAIPGGGYIGANQENFTIQKGTPNIIKWPSGITATFGEMLSQVTIPNNGESAQPGAFIWTLDPGTTPVGNAGTQFYNMTFTPNDTGNYNNVSNNISITVRRKPIENVIINVTAPMTGQIPDANAVVPPGVHYTPGSVSWFPTHNPFRVNTEYMATVTLTADSNYSFEGLIRDNVSFANNIPSVFDNRDTVLILSYAFSATIDRVPIGITVINEPLQMTYTHGDLVDLTGLAVKIAYQDGGNEDFALDRFPAYIAINPMNNMPIARNLYNGQNITVSFSYGGNNYSDTTNSVFNISPKSDNVNISVPMVGNKVYDGNTTATVAGTPIVTGLLFNDVVVPVGGTAVFDNKNAGNDKTVTFSGWSLGGTHAGNYDLAGRQPAPVTANITHLQLVIGSPVLASPKVYDGTIDAESLVSIGTLANNISGDNISASIASAKYNSPDVAAARWITVVYNISGTDAGNYIKPVDQTINYTISKATPIIAPWPSGMTAVFKELLIQVPINPNGVSDPAGTFSWTNPAVEVGNVGLRPHSMTFTPDDNGNYTTLINAVDGVNDVNINVFEAPIVNAAISVTAPVTGATPSLPTGTNNYTIGTVTWIPDSGSFNGTFLAETVYTVSVTLSANANYTFTNGLSAATINGLPANVTYNNGAAATLLSQPFPKTDPQIVIGMNIISQPQLDYTHGDTLILTNLAVKLFYNIGLPEDIEFLNFTAKNIKTSIGTTDITDGDQLSHVNHDTKVIVAIYNNDSTISANTIPLTVSKKQLTITGVTATERAYTTSNSVVLEGGTLLGVIGGDTVSYTLGNGTIATRNVDNGKPVTTNISLNGASADNYTLTQPSGITVNITPAPLTITGVEHTKQYDGNTTVSAPISILFDKVFGSDDVYVENIIAEYTNADAGTQNIDINTLTLSGSAADNYYLSTSLPIYNVPVSGGITKADGLPLNKPPTWKANSNTNTVIITADEYEATDLAFGQTVEYAISTSINATTGLKWKTDREFKEYNDKSFIDNTSRTFYLYARSAANDNYNASVDIAMAVDVIKYYLVEFESNDNSFSIQKRLVLDEDTINIPNTPNIIGSYLYRWKTYTEVSWDFSSPLDRDIKLFAEWKPNPIIIIIYDKAEGILKIESGIAIIYLTSGLNRPIEMSFKLNEVSYSSIMWNYDNMSLASNKEPFVVNSSNPLFNYEIDSDIKLTVNIDGNDKNLSIPFKVEL